MKVQVEQSCDGRMEKMDDAKKEEREKKGGKVRPISANEGKKTLEKKHCCSLGRCHSLKGNKCNGGLPLLFMHLYKLSQTREWKARGKNTS